MLSHRAPVMLLIAAALLAGNTARAKLSKEDLAYFMEAEARMRSVARAILYGRGDDERRQASASFSALLKETLEHDHSFEYPFDSLQSIARLTAPDKAFRIFNWNLPLEDGTFAYFGFVQTRPRRKKQSDIYTLTDASPTLTDPQKLRLTHEQWFGAHYYEIIPEKKRKSKYYTLLGWDGNTRQTTCKIIDVMYFDKGTLHFGAPIFAGPNRNAHRLIYEYSSQAVMSLKYYPKIKRIVMDHLGPAKPNMEGQRQYYGPDLSYDAFELRKGKWIYIPDVDITNPANKTAAEEAGKEEDRKKLENKTQKGLLPK